MPIFTVQPRLKRRTFQFHRWLSLSVALLWLLQVVTGTLIVFHWEWDDATIGQRYAATDPVAIGRRIALLAAPGSGRHVSSVWTSAGLADRYDITVVDDRTGGATAVRVTGDGTPIRTLADGDRSLADTIVALHQTLLSGPAGSWIIGLSGVLLITNLLLAMIAAWPRRGTWRRALTPSRKGPALARYYSWHRAVGLAGILPALILVGTGTARVFEDGLGRAIGAQEISMPARPGTPVVGFGQAVAIAERRLPGSQLTAVQMPGAEDATYKVRLRMPGEWRRAYGASFVFVDAVNGGVRGVFRAGDAPRARAFMDILFPIHTGEAAGFAGRLLVLSLGLWLGSMIVIGVRLSWLRRLSTKKRHP